MSVECGGEGRGEEGRGCTLSTEQFLADMMYQN